MLLWLSGWVSQILLRCLLCSGPEMAFNAAFCLGWLP